MKQLFFCNVIYLDPERGDGWYCGLLSKGHLYIVNGPWETPEEAAKHLSGNMDDYPEIV